MTAGAATEALVKPAFRISRTNTIIEPSTNSRCHIIQNILRFRYLVEFKLRRQGRVETILLSNPSNHHLFKRTKPPLLVL